MCGGDAIPNGANGHANGETVTNGQNGTTNELSSHSSHPKPTVRLSPVPKLSQLSYPASEVPILTRSALSSLQAPATNPYAPVHDALSNVGSYKLIESTLREGEQFASAFFDTGSFSSTSLGSCGPPYPSMR